MLIRAGFEAAFDFTKPGAILLMAYVHPSRASTIRWLQPVSMEPRAEIYQYFDGYGNLCGRTFVPAGRVAFRTDALIEDDGLPDVQVQNALQHGVQDLPSDVLLFLLASRYCEVDSELRDTAWSLFGHLPAGWPLVQAVCNYVHQHIRFDYMQARANRTALEVYRERVGVCRDYMHLAITFCRSLNIPARYCTGYLGDIGVPPQPCPDGFQRVVRGLPGRPVACVRCPQQHAAHRPHPDGPRPRRRRRGPDDLVRREPTPLVSSVDRRSAGRHVAGFLGSLITRSMAARSTCPETAP